MVRVRVAIPHFFSDGASEGSGGYGSGRKGNSLIRSISLARCLGSVLALGRAQHDLILNIAEKCIELSSPSVQQGLSNIYLEVHLFVCGEHWLPQVVSLFGVQIKLHKLDLADPRQLPLEAVRYLLHMSEPADFHLYLEDDLVIQDVNFIDKIHWFYDNTDDQYVLMPHRRELTVANAPMQLFVDGPIKPVDHDARVWAREESVFAHYRYWNGQDIGFVKTANPHSGSFCISQSQLETVRNGTWPPPAFVGPLETAATGIILPYYPVLKPSWEYRHFLMIEHGNPSFLGFVNKLPHS